MKKIIALIPVITAAFAIAPAQAGRVEPKPVHCWFLQGETITLNQTCTYESSSWAGGGIRSLTWEDGVKTTIAWGEQGRGGKRCDEVSVDGVCGTYQARDPKNLNHLSEPQVKQRQKNGRIFVNCAQVKGKSICWF
jgi:hypothetical protein